jgi:phage-related protein (TIGR01555 family)
MAKKRTVKNGNADFSTRNDGFIEKGTGRGSSTDKVSRISPSASSMTPSEARRWYLSNGFIQTIIDAPAEDAMREWIEIRTNRDEDNPETGAEGLGIARLIENRLADLEVRKKLTDLIRASRLYSDGGFLFFGIKAKNPQDDEALGKPMPADILRLDYLNVISPEYVNIIDESYSPLSKLYHRKTFQVQGVNVHSDRMAWMSHSYIPEERRGISVVETIIDAVLAQDTALWSVNHLVFEMAAKIFKSPKVSALSPDKLAEFVAKLKATLSTHSAVALDEGEEFSRIQTGQITGIKEIFDYIFENLSGFARIPKSRLMGQSQGVITAGQFDLLSYYDSIAKFQELEVRPILEKIITLVVKEKEGEVFRALGGNIDALDWDFDFNPLWKIGPVEKADIELKQAQRDQIYVTTGVLSPDEIKQERFADLEEFSEWGEAPIDMKVPVIKPAENDSETGKNEEIAESA